jgi:hypothetical protein
MIREMMLQMEGTSEDVVINLISLNLCRLSKSFSIFEDAMKKRGGIFLQR